MVNQPPAMITVGCPGCGARLNAPSGPGLIEGPCPTCGQVIRTGIPQGASLRAMTPGANSSPSEPHQVSERVSIEGCDLPGHMATQYEAIVNQLAAYEQAGVPTEHPDRLHLVEALFRAATPPEAAFPDYDPSSLQMAIPEAAPAEEDLVSERLSHLPPPRRCLAPEPRVPGKRSAREHDEERRFKVNRMRPSRIPGAIQAIPEADVSAGHKAPPIANVRMIGDPEVAPYLESDREVAQPVMGFSWLEKVGATFILLLVGLGGVFAWKHVLPPQSVTPVKVPTAFQVEAAIPQLPTGLTAAETVAIKERVKAFHHATSPEAKLSHLMDGLVLLDEVATHYRNHPLEPDEVSLDAELVPVETERGLYYRGSGRYPNGEAMEFYATRQRGDFLLDWPSLCGYSRIPWREFLEQKPKLPVSFRLIAEELRSLESEGVPEAYVLKLRAFGSDETAWAYVDPVSDTGLALSETMSGRQDTVRLSLSLAYETTSDGFPKLWVTALEGDSWLQPEL